MQRVDSLLGEVRDLLRPLEKKILGHPYLADLEEKKTGRERLKYFAGEQHRIITSDLRSVGLLLSRHGLPPGRDFFWMVLQGETDLDRHLASIPPAPAPNEPHGGVSRAEKGMLWS